jgi:ribonuclease P protein component
MPHFVLSYRANEMPHNRYGLVASRRIGNAVQRNKVRRRLREALYNFHPKIGQQYLLDTSDVEGFDLILIARQSITKATFQELVQQLSDALQRAELMEI